MNSIYPKRFERRAVVLAALGLLPFAVTSSAAQTSDTIVRLAARPLHGGVSSVVEELSLGALDGPAEYAFGSIADIAVGNDGALLILDASLRSNPVLRLYDARGVFLREVGRRGGGPGEFIAPGAVAAMPDGRFLLLDRLNRRITVYSRTGDYIEAWPVPSYNTTLGAPGAMRVDSAGIITIRFGPPVGLAGPHTIGTEAVVRLRTGGMVIDTLPRPHLPDVLRGVTITAQRNGTARIARLVAPYSPNAVWQWSPLGYFVTGVSSRYAIDLRLPHRQGEAGGSPSVWRSGDPVISIRRNVPPVRVTSAERADQRAHVQGQLRVIRGAQSGRLPDVPHVKPFFRWFYIGDDGRIWIQVHTQSERRQPPDRRSARIDGVQQLNWREPNVFDVFEPSGTYVGRVQLPDNLRPVRFRGDHVWAVAVDQFDVQYVKRYRVRWK